MVNETDDSDKAGLLAGRYQVLQTLGRGGYGAVYEAFDLEWKTRLALKTLQRMDPDALLRFKAEFRSLQDLEHPNLVHLGELTCSDGVWFFTMELIDGTDFFDWIRPIAERVGAIAVRKLDEQRLRSALVQLVDGLVAVHASGRVHCDIKPSNIRVEPNGRVVLLDFGLVTAVMPSHIAVQTEAVLGTPSYMAPEQCRGEAITPAADWYGVGVLLYEVLTGRLPFDGGGAQVFLDKQHLIPPSPLALAHDVPRDLSDLTMQLLSIEPADRPTGESVLSLLLNDNDAQAGEPSLRSVRPSSPDIVRFIGRTEQLAQLGKHLARTQASGPGFVYLAGESGVGKTALARAFADQTLRLNGTLVLRSRCYERETVPYKAFDGIVDDLARHLGTLDARQCRALLPSNAKLLAQIFPVLSRVKPLTRLALPSVPRDPLVLRSQTFAVLREILARLAQHCPLLLLIDDLQWTDLDSLTIMEELLTSADAPACMLLATGRPLTQMPAELRQGLEPLLGLHTSEQIEIAGLAGDEAELLVRSLAQQPHDSAVFKRIADEAKGHPLFAAELIRHVEAGHALGVSWEVDDALRNRLSLLEPPTRLLLETLAVAGAPTVHSVLAHALQLNATQLSRRLAQLRAAHLVRSEDRLHAECYHDRVRRTVVNALSPELQRQRHLSLAHALSVVGGADPEQVAYEWRSAGEVRKAAHYCAQAAEASYRALAFNRAARLYDEALAQPDAFDDEQLAKLRAAQAQALSSAGFSARAADMYLLASEGCPPGEARFFRRKATQLMLRSGRISEGLELADDVLSEVGLSRPRSPAGAVMRLAWERTRLSARLRSYEHATPVPVPGKQSAANEDILELLWAVAPSLAFVDLIGGSALQSRYARMALSSGDLQHVVRSLSIEAISRSTMDAPPQTRATKILQQLREVAGSSDDPYLRASVWMAHGYAHWMSFRVEEAVASLVQAERLFNNRCVDVAWELTNARAGLLNALWNTGRLARHEELVREWQRDARDRGDRYACTQLTTIGLSYQSSLRSDKPAAAEEALQTILQGWPETFQLPHWGQGIGRQLVALYRGDGSAYPLMQASSPGMRGSQLLRVPYLGLLTHTDWGWACLDQGARSEATERSTLTREALRHARAIRRTKWPLACAFADQIQAQVMFLEGRGSEAVPLLCSAAKALSEQHSVYQYPTSYLAGKLMGGEEGRALSTRALDWATREGVSNPQQWFATFAPALRVVG